MHTGNVSVFLEDWQKRDQSTAEVDESLRQDLGELSGVRAQPRVGGGLVGSRGQPIQIVLGGPEYRDRKSVVKGKSVSVRVPPRARRTLTHHPPPHSPSHPPPPPHPH